MKRNALGKKERKAEKEHERKLRENAFEKKERTRCQSDVIIHGDNENIRVKRNDVFSPVFPQ